MNLQSNFSTASCAQQAWLKSAVGHYACAQEQALYDQAVVDLFGFNALQMGGAGMDLLQHSRMPYRYHAVDSHMPLPGQQLYCCDDFLPFADMSLDLLLLPHCLEFSQRPHQTLREAARVMVPEGHLLISGFNPLSLWGMVAGIKKLLTRKKTYPWNGQFISLIRMKDWLALLGFEVLLVQACCHVPPFEKTSWRNRLQWMDNLGARCAGKLGGVYFIVAKKRVVGMTPIKPHWNKPSLKSSLIARPTQSNSKPTDFSQ